MDKVCGLDVHKDSVFACILDEGGKKILEERYGTLTPDLDKLRDVLVAHSVGRAAMESTSIYWMPVMRILEPDFDVQLVNPYLIKQLPGRKTDVKDAHWIAQCLQKDMLRGSYVPNEDLQQMRQYSRRYSYLSKNIVRVEQRIDNHYSDAISVLAIMFPIRVRMYRYVKLPKRLLVEKEIPRNFAGWYTDESKTSMVKKLSPPL